MSDDHIGMLQNESLGEEHGELFDEFGRVVDWRERTNLGGDLTSAVPVLRVVEKTAQRSSDLVGGSLVLADGKSCAELHQLGWRGVVRMWLRRRLASRAGRTGRRSS